MPVCLDCGNTSAFISSKVSSETPVANPPQPLAANFNPDGDLAQLEFTGRDENLLDAAFKNPNAYFDTCGICNSHNLKW